MQTTDSPAAADALNQNGWALVASGLEAERLAELGATAFATDAAGTRCLLDIPSVRAAAETMRETLVVRGLLPVGAVAIQAIAFDKNPAANWKVTWHQDLMLPLARSVSDSGYELPSRKAGVDYARPPRAVLETLLAVRLHIDDCDEANGPLRVSPGSHRQGVIRSTDIDARREVFGETTVLAAAGEALLMRPLLLHASSPAREPRHRRVLHIVYHDGSPVAEPWHRAV